MIKAAPAFVLLASVSSVDRQTTGMDDERARRSAVLLVDEAVGKRGAVRPALEASGMPQNFLGCGCEQAFLMSPSLLEWVPEDHLVWTILEAVEETDLSDL